MTLLANYLRVSSKHSSFVRPSFILSRLAYDKRGNEMFCFWRNTLYKRAFRSNEQEIRGTARPNSFALKEFLRETEASERSQRSTIFNISLSQDTCKLITKTTIREDRFCRRLIYCTNTYCTSTFSVFDKRGLKISMLSNNEINTFYVVFIFVNAIIKLVTNRAFLAV